MASKPCSFAPHCTERYLITKDGNPLSQEDSENVYNYMKYLSMDDFSGKNKKYIQYIDDQAAQLKPYLPKKLQKDKTMIKNFRWSSC